MDIVDDVVVVVIPDPPRKKVLRKLNLKPNTSWGVNQSACPKEILLTLIKELFLDVEHVITESLCAPMAQLIDDCRAVISTVLCMQRVCVMFYAVINNEKSIWEALYRHTRRYQYMFGVARPPIDIPRPFCPLKEFVILDTREYALRKAAKSCNLYTVWSLESLDYKRATMRRNDVEANELFKAHTATK